MPEDVSTSGVGGSGGITGTSINVFCRVASMSDKLSDANKVLGGSQTDDEGVANSGGIICKSTVLLPTLRWISIDPSTSWHCAQSEAVDASVISAIDSTLMDLEWTGFIGIGNVYLFSEKNVMFAAYSGVIDRWSPFHLLFDSSTIGDNPNNDCARAGNFTAKSS